MGAALRGAVAIAITLGGLGCSEGSLGTGSGGNCADETAASSVAACAVVNTSVLTAEEAAAIDPNVVGDLELLGRAFKIGFHQGDFACGGAVPTTDGQLLIQPRVREIVLREQAPNFDGVPAAQCTNYFVYNSDITFTADDGTLSGTFTGEVVHYLDGVHVFAKAPALALGGALGVRVNPARPWVAQVAGQFTLGPDNAAKGHLFSATDYTDCAMPLQDQGDGMFWPVPSADDQRGPPEAPAVVRIADADARRAARALTTSG